MNEDQIAKIQRDIARIATTADEAQQIMRVLNGTKWEKAIEHERMHRKQPCYDCSGRFLVTELVSIMRSNGKTVKYCPQCAKTGVTPCDYCEQIFACYGQADYRCFLCKQAHKDIPHLSKCGLCLQKYQYEYYDKILICPPCKEAKGIGEKWLRSESVKVSTHVGRARTLDLPASLSLFQWIQTLDDFKWTCCYCQITPYQELDHYIPLSKGGATLPNNCVPACKRCNTSKGQRHPNKVTSIPRCDLERVAAYLSHK